MDLDVPPGPEAALTRPACTATLQPSQAPHWTPMFLAPRAPAGAMARLRWTGGSGRLRLALPAGGRDVRRYAALTLRAAPDPANPGPVDLTVRVTDGRGRSADVAVSAVSDALRALPGSDGFRLPKTLLRTVRVPLGALGGLDLRDVRAVELRTDRVPSGAAYVSDVAFLSPALGRSGPARLPQLSVTDARLPEGDTGARSLDFTVSLSRRSHRPVAVHVGSLSDDPFGVVASVDRWLVVPAGHTGATVSLAVRPNRRDGPDEILTGLALALAREAVVDDGHGLGVVVDDDPPPRLVVGEGTAREGARVLRFPLRLSAPSDNPVVVVAELRSGTAVLGEDVAVEEPEFVVVGAVDPRRVAGFLEVRLVDDAVAEPTETFTARVVDVFGARLAGPTVLTGTIRDDDG